MKKENEILKALELMPEFLNLKKGIEESVSEDDFYIQECYPEKEWVEYDESGKAHKCFMKDDQAYESALDEFLEGFRDDLRDEWVHDHKIRNDVTEFIIALAKQILK